MPIITISRQMGSGGSFLAEQLAAKLDYRLVDKVILTRAAQLAGVAEERLAELEQGELEGRFERFLRNMARGLPDLDHYYRAFAELEEDTPEATQYAYYGHTRGSHDRLRREDVVRYYEAAIRELSQRGNVIVLGRGGQVILGDAPHSLHVRVTADLNWRAEQVAARRQIDAEEAVKTIREDDAKRLGYLRENYQEDSNHALLYGLCLRTDRVSVERAVSFISQWAVEESKRQHAAFEAQQEG